jgi:hypothetical protein
MTGCFRFTDLEATLLVLPAGGVSTFSLGVPNNVGLQGLQVTSQTYAFAPGANPAGVLSSNGVALIIGP